jgi:hypothetical protein
MSQRLGIVAALLGDPDVLMFDEPVNGLLRRASHPVRQALQHHTGPARRAARGAAVGGDRHRVRAARLRRRRDHPAYRGGDHRDPRGDLPDPGAGPRPCRTAGSRPSSGGFRAAKRFPPSPARHPRSTTTCSPPGVSSACSPATRWSCSPSAPGCSFAAMRDPTAQDQAGYPGSVERPYAWLRRHPWLVALPGAGYAATSWPSSACATGSRPSSTPTRPASLPR